MREVVLLHRVTGIIGPEDFAVVNRDEIRATETGGMTRTTHISLDPYLALRMAREIPDAGGLAPYSIIGRTIGEVIRSDDPAFVPGDKVLGFGRWSSHDNRPAVQLRKLDMEDVPVEAHLSVAGHSGFTAWLGIRLADLKAGDTFVVSGAAGAVGSIAGQLAKRKGCRVIGIAGGRYKIGWIVDRLGFDAGIDHHGADIGAALRTAAPDGIDVLFENVGTKILDPALASMRPQGRVMLCGLMQHYQDREPVTLFNFRAFLEKSIRLEPFSIYNYGDLEPVAREELFTAVRDGDLRFSTCLTNGLENVPAAFVAMLNGGGIGKHIARVG